MFPLSKLEKLICCVCGQYLSCPPIKVYHTREVKCGRCSKDDDCGVWSIFNFVAEGLRFPCINRFEGCEKLLKFTEVLHHEQTCKGSNYSCPLCLEDVHQLSLPALINHFRNYHKNNIFIYPRWYFQLDQLIGQQCYVYCNYDKSILMLILVSCELSVMQVKCFSVPKQRNIFHKAKLFSTNSEEIYFESEWNVCDIWNDDNNNGIRIPVDNMSTVILELEFEVLKSPWASRLHDLEVGEGEKWSSPFDLKPFLTNWSPRRQDLRKSSISVAKLHCTDMRANRASHFWCSFCESYWPLSGQCTYYRCSNRSLYYCVSCKNMCLNNCLKCKCLPIISTDLHNNNLFFFCKFDCGKSFLDVISHEEQCSKKPPSTFKLSYNQNSILINTLCKSGCSLLKILPNYDYTKYNTRVKFYWNDCLYSFVVLSDTFLVPSNANFKIIVSKKD